MDDDIRVLREKYLNHDFDARSFPIDAEKTMAYARLCGETAPRFLDRDHPDFQAPVTYLACLSSTRALPIDFPRLGIGLDAGKAIEAFRPLRTGITLTGRSHLHDIYTKTGRSGRMVFLVSRIEFYDPDGHHVANSDSRLVMREKGA
jgi:hypothetical protein